MGLSDAVTVGIGDNDGRGLMEGRFDGAGDTVGKRLGGSDGFWVGGFVVVGSKVGGWLGVKLDGRTEDRMVPPMAFGTTTGEP